MKDLGHLPRRVYRRDQEIIVEYLDADSDPEVQLIMNMADARSLMRALLIVLEP